MKLHEHLFGNGKPRRCNAWAKPRLYIYIYIYKYIYNYIYIGTFGPDVLHERIKTDTSPYNSLVFDRTREISQGNPLEGWNSKAQQSKTVSRWHLWPPVHLHAPRTIK